VSNVSSGASDSGSHRAFALCVRDETSAYNNTLTPGTYPKEKKLNVNYLIDNN
jgi:hypothetical protein